MSELIISIIAGLAVLIIGAWLGIGGTTKVAVQNGYKVKKIGKWMMVISWILILIGLSLCGKGHYTLNNPSTAYGTTLIILGVPLLTIGKFVSWFQKP